MNFTQDVRLMPFLNSVLLSVARVELREKTAVKRFILRLVT